MDDRTILVDDVRVRVLGISDIDAEQNGRQDTGIHDYEDEHNNNIEAKVQTIASSTTKVQSWVGLLNSGRVC